MADILFANKKLEAQCQSSTKVNDLLKRLVNGTLNPGDKLERLSSEHPLYSLRVNKTERIIFSYDPKFRNQNKRMTPIILNYDQKHQYDSKYFDPKIYREFINSRSDDLTSEIQSLLATPNPEPVDELEYDRVNIMGENVFMLSEEQKSARVPGIVMGNPGSGKSTSAYAMLEEYLGTIEPGQSALYVTLNKKLANKIKSWLEDSPFYVDSARDQVKVLSYLELFRLHYPGLNVEENAEENVVSYLLGRKALLGSDISSKDLKIRAQFFYQEFRILSGYIDVNEYIASGRNISHASDEDRKLISKAYQHWKQEDKTNYLEFTPIHGNPASAFDLVIIDEAQDFSNLQNKILSSSGLVKNQNVLFCFDPKQNIKDASPKELFLKSIFDPRMKIVVKKFGESHRCPPCVMRLASEFDMVRRKFNKSGKQEAQMNIPLEKGGVIGWLNPADPTSKMTIDNLKNDADTCIITDKDTLSKLEKEGFTRVYTAEEIKGLDYPNVTLYNPFSDDVFREINKLMIALEAGNKIDTASNYKLSTFISEVFVSITRARKKIIIHQAMMESISELMKIIIRNVNDKVVVETKVEIDVNKSLEDAQKMYKNGHHSKAKNVLMLEVYKDDPDCASKVEKKLADWELQYNPKPIEQPAKRNLSDVLALNDPIALLEFIKNLRSGYKDALMTGSSDQFLIILWKYLAYLPDHLLSQESSEYLKDLLKILKEVPSKSLRKIMNEFFCRQDFFLANTEANDFIIAKAKELGSDPIVNLDLAAYFRSMTYLCGSLQSARKCQDSSLEYIEKARKNYKAVSNTSKETEILQLIRGFKLAKVASWVASDRMWGDLENNPRLIDYLLGLLSLTEDYTTILKLMHKISSVKSSYSPILMKKIFLQATEIYKNKLDSDSAHFYMNIKDSMGSTINPDRCLDSLIFFTTESKLDIGLLLLDSQFRLQDSFMNICSDYDCLDKLLKICLNYFLAKPIELLNQPTLQIYTNFIQDLKSSEIAMETLPKVLLHEDAPQAHAENIQTILMLIELIKDYDQNLRDKSLCLSVLYKKLSQMSNHEQSFSHYIHESASFFMLAQKESLNVKPDIFYETFFLKPQPSSKYIADLVNSSDLDQLDWNYQSHDLKRSALMSLVIHKPEGYQSAVRKLLEKPNYDINVLDGHDCNAFAHAVISHEDLSMLRIFRISDQFNLVSSILAIKKQKLRSLVVNKLFSNPNFTSFLTMGELNEIMLDSSLAESFAQYFPHIYSEEICHRLYIEHKIDFYEDRTEMLEEFEANDFNHLELRVRDHASVSMIMINFELRSAFINFIVRNESYSLLVPFMETLKKRGNIHILHYFAKLMLVDFVATEKLPLKLRIKYVNELCDVLGDRIYANQPLDLQIFPGRLETANILQTIVISHDKYDIIAASRYFEKINGADRMDEFYLRTVEAFSAHVSFKNNISDTEKLKTTLNGFFNHHPHILVKAIVDFMQSPDLIYLSRPLYALTLASLLIDFVKRIFGQTDNRITNYYFIIVHCFWSIYCHLSDIPDKEKILLSANDYLLSLSKFELTPSQIKQGDELSKRITEALDRTADCDQLKIDWYDELNKILDNIKELTEESALHDHFLDNDIGLEMYTHYLSSGMLPLEINYQLRKNQETALMKYARNKMPFSYQAMNLLMYECNADLYLRNAKGHTAFLIAVIMGQPLKTLKLFFDHPKFDLSRSLQNVDKEILNRALIILLSNNETRALITKDAIGSLIGDVSFDRESKELIDNLLRERACFEESKPTIF